jgi:replicative DNA helicase
MAVAEPPLAPPHDLEAEQSVLGAIFLSDVALYGLVIQDGLRADDFYREQHRIVYHAMVDLYNASEPVDIVTVKNRLRETGRLDEVGGDAGVESLAGMVPAAGNLRHYARIVRDHALLRRLLTTTMEIQASVLSHEAGPRDLVEHAEKAMLEVAHDDRQKDFRSIHDVLDTELEKLHRLSRDRTALTGTRSGYTKLDELTGGFQNGNLIVIAARPSMGKCLSGSALLYDPTTGARRRLGDVVAAVERGERAQVAALGADLKLHARPVHAAMRSGVQPVFRLTTRLGRRVEATANHPLLTIQGWRELSKLERGARIAVARALPLTVGPSAMSDAELVLLAALVADGNLTQRTPRFSFGRDSAVVEEVRRAAVAVGAELPMPSAGRGAAYLSAGRRASTDPVAELCRRHGIWGKRARDNFVPDAIFGVSRDQVACFLSILFACDGLFELAMSDLWWDEVASIEPIGEQETFDLEIEGEHNFVADDVVVHNSALVSNIAENASVQDGVGVALFSLEMSEAELAQRFIASQATIKGEELRKGRVDERRWPKILQACQRLSEAPLFVDDSSDVGLLEIRAKARRLHAQHALGLVIVDYLQLMRADERVENRVEQVGQMSRGLKILARELDVPVIALSQLNRGVEARTDKRPILSDLRESGSIEQDADLVMFIYRDEYYHPDDTEEPGVAELIVAKHRNGPTDKVKLVFRHEFPKFMNYVSEERVA